MWGCLRWIDHTGLASDKGDMSFLGPPCSASRLTHEGTIPPGPCVSCTSQPGMQLGAWQGHWPQLALRFLLSTIQDLRWLVGGQGTIPGGPCLLCSTLISTTQFATCARAHSLRCAMRLLMVADLRLSWSWPMWTVHEPRNSSLANVNQLRLGRDVSVTKIPATYFLLPLAIVHIPLSLRGRKGLK